MKQALLVVSFGTSVAQTRACITAVEDILLEQAPDRDFFRAFTSPTIRRKLAQRGEDILSLKEALEQIEAMGYQDVIVQPTHMLYGIEYDKIKKETDWFSFRFERFALGKPLLADTEDLQYLALTLMRHYPAQEDEATVFMGHGTEHFANAVYPALQTAFSLAGRDDIFVGTVEGWPGFADVRKQVAGQYKKAHLIPLMLVAGDHACNDMAGEDDDSWKSQLEADGVQVRCTMRGLGEMEDVRLLYRKHMQELL